MKAELILDAPDAWPASAEDLETLTDRAVAAASKVLRRAYPPVKAPSRRGAAAEPTDDPDDADPNANRPHQHHRTRGRSRSRSRQRLRTAAGPLRSSGGAGDASPSS